MLVSTWLNINMFVEFHGCIHMCAAVEGGPRRERYVDNNDKCRRRVTRHQLTDVLSVYLNHIILAIAGPI